MHGLPYVLLALRHSKVAVIKDTYARNKKYPKHARFFHALALAACGLLVFMSHHLKRGNKERKDHIIKIRPDKIPSFCNDQKRKRKLQNQTLSITAKTTSTTSGPKMTAPTNTTTTTTTTPILFEDDDLTQANPYVHPRDEIVRVMTRM